MQVKTERSRLQNMGHALCTYPVPQKTLVFELDRKTVILTWFWSLQVKFSMNFKAREMGFQKQGITLFEKVQADIGEVGLHSAPLFFC